MFTIGIDASRALRARRTGTERYAYELTRRLVARAQAERAIRVRLYVDREPSPEERTLFAGAEWGVLRRGRLWTHLALGPELWRRPPDVFFEPAHVLPLQHPASSVVTVHDLGYEHFPDSHPRLHRWYLRLTTRWHTYAAHRILADSIATRDDLINMYSAEPAKIDVVYPGVDLERFTPVHDSVVAREVRAKYNTGEHYLLYVGTLQPRKNLERLVRAFGKAVDNSSKTRLILGGSTGWSVDKLRKTVDNLGKAVDISFPGYINDGDLPALLSGAAGFVFPSLFEGFGLPVLEAQACGTPVLTSTTSSLPEVAGNAAILVDPLDVDAIAGGLRRLLHDDSLRCELVERGLVNVKRFTWDRTAETVWKTLLTPGKYHG